MTFLVYIHKGRVIDAAPIAKHFIGKPTAALRGWAAKQGGLRIVRMAKPWLILDANYLAHRAHYSTGGLRFEELGTGIIFGLYRDLIELQNRFDTDRVVFCFDSITSKRREAVPSYKQTRAARHTSATAEEKAERDEFRRQLKLLRDKYLPETGFTNVFCAKGYEGDDLIAAICNKLPSHEEAIVVTADGDLLQCLRNNITLYNPRSRTLTGLKQFKEEWGIEPNQWPIVKAWAGDKSDEIEGVHGVGLITAAKHLRGELKTARRLLFEKTENIGLMQQNLPLVRLPYPGTPYPVLRPNAVTPEKWEAVAKELGFRGLRSLTPLGARAMRPRGVRRGFGVG